MLMVKSQMNDKLFGLQFGVDDYVMKLFNYVEFIFWVKNMVWCVKKMEVVVSYEVIEVGEIVICFKERKVYVSG